MLTYSICNSAKPEIPLQAPVKYAYCAKSLRMSLSLYKCAIIELKLYIEIETIAPVSTVKRTCHFNGIGTGIGPVKGIKWIEEYKCEHIYLNSPYQPVAAINFVNKLV